MKPTKAQIEAAAKAMEQKMFAPHELPLDDELHAKYIDTATAALTAAANVPEQEHILQKPGQKPGLLPSGNIAAEVGDELESGVLLTKAIDEVIAEDIEKERLQELVSQGIQIERQLRKELLTLRAATIERCAQVVDDLADKELDAGQAALLRRAAAAIRALKDKP